MEGYQPIGTGYKPIGTGYNRGGPNTGYGFTGALEEIKSNNIFQGQFSGKASSPKQPLMPPSSPAAVSNPAQYLTGNPPSPAQDLLLGNQLDAYDSVKDTNNNGVIDPWEI